jgi:hypothetical protein
MPDVGLEARPRGEPAAAHDIGLDERPGAVADHAHGLALLEEGTRKRDGPVVRPRDIGVRHPASAGCAIRIGHPIAAFIVTVFHVVALLVFGSVRYRGRAERLVADTLLYGIPPAIVISLVVG